ncbi:MAG: alpha/beta hydrolase family esterase, partial [Flavobacteriaceae bacterium]
HWNVGGWTNGSSVNDVEFIDFLIELISDQYNINQDRVYATGMSNGGFFSYLLVCQLSNKIAAIASVTGSMTNETFNNCDPSKEVPVLQIHGTEDPIVTYEGNSAIGSIGIESVLSYWKSNNYCDEPKTTELYDSNPDDSFYIHRVLFDNGVNGSKVDHYKVYGGEHFWFMEDDINSSELIWEFFSQHDLNGYID